MVMSGSILTICDHRDLAVGLHLDLTAGEGVSSWDEAPNRVKSYLLR